MFLKFLANHKVMNVVFLTFLLGSIFSFAGPKKETKKEETLTLKCKVSMCPDMAGYNGTCNSDWVADANVVPPIYATGNLPKCECTPSTCVPNEPIKAVGFFETDPSYPKDMNVKRFKVKAVLTK